MTVPPERAREAQRISRRSTVPPFHTMKVLERALALRASGRPVQLLLAGQPSTPAPRAVLAAAHRALDADLLGYGPATGLPELRTAIAGHYRRTYDLDVDPAAVAVTTGSTGGFLLAFLAAFDAGDTVALARPGYPAYRNLLTALGCEVVELPCGPKTRFQPTVEMLEEIERPVRGVVVASPANPTGTMLTPGELDRIGRWCDEHGAQLISDEIYHGISYAGSTACAWSSHPSAIVVNSFSKYWSMTGWRLGWLLLPEHLRDPVDDLASNTALCPPTLAQRAAMAAFDDYAELDAHVDRYRENRSLLMAELPRLGLDRLAPADGAFYAWADVSEHTDDSMTFVHDLLEHTGLALAPGVDFDPVDGHRFVRLSFAGDRETIERALEILSSYLAHR